VKFPYQRLSQLFDLLQSETLPQDELANRLAVSTRTVRTDITALNELLAEYGASFVLNRGEGYQLKVEDTERYERWLQPAPVAARVPRTSTERIHALLIRFLTSAFALKLEDLADEWFISRTTLQSDMAGVREWLSRYELELEARPRYGMKLFGRESAIRTCLTDLLYQSEHPDAEHSLLYSDALSKEALAVLQPSLTESLSRFHIRLADDAEWYLRLYCAVAVRRITEGYPLVDFGVADVADDVREAVRYIVDLLRPVIGQGISQAEEAWLQVQIAARRIEDVVPDAISPDDGDSLVDYILVYINHEYGFDLRNDPQLRADLLTHIKTMITRLRYQIHIPNPLLSNIKQHYPMAWDVTLAAVSSWAKYTPYNISENEIGFLVLHIGVGLERHYDVGYQLCPRVLLVCDSGNSTTRMIQAVLARRYPQAEICQIVSLWEYEQLAEVAEDFVISTARLSDKGKPVVVLSPFPTDYQLEQLGKLVLQDRTRPYMLEKFFDAGHFRILEQSMDRSELFRQLCHQLEQEGIVEQDFYPSVEEREAIVSTMLGEGIALPHSLGLMAKKTCVYTVLAPKGVQWGEETASVIFLLAISKNEYEEAMAIYDLFVTFLRERAVTQLRNCQDFASFKAVAMESLNRL